MPALKEEAAPAPTVVHGDAVELEDLKAQLGQVNAMIPREIAVGNDVTAMRARRASIAEAIAALEEVIEAYPFAKREAEQADLREKVDIAFLTRRENMRRQTEAQAEADALQEKLEAKLKEVGHWRFVAGDGVLTATMALQKHIDRFGDLSAPEGS